MAKRIVVWTETAAKRREILKYCTKKKYTFLRLDFRR